MIVDKWVEFVMSSWFTANVKLSEQQWSGALWDYDKYGNDGDGFISAFQSSLKRQYPQASDGVRCELQGSNILIVRSCKPFGLLPTLKIIEDEHLRALETCRSDGRAARERNASLEAVRKEIDEIISGLAADTSSFHSTLQHSLRP